MKTQHSMFAFWFLAIAVALTTADRAHAHGLQILLDADGSGALTAEYASGAHARVTGVQIGDALLWDERVRNAPDYPSALSTGGLPGTMLPGEPDQVITWNGVQYLVEYHPLEWDTQLEWRIEPQSSDFPGITPQPGAFAAIDDYYGDGTRDLRVNLQGALKRWDGQAFVDATDASVSLTTQEWPDPTDGVLYDNVWRGYWYAELDQEVTSSTGVVPTAPYDFAWAEPEYGEHWHYLWTLNGPDEQTNAADGVYLAEFTISSGDGGLESDPMWLLLRQGLDANSSAYLAAEAAAIAAVPEPTALAAVTLGLSTLGVISPGMRRRRA